VIILAISYKGIREKIIILLGYDIVYYNITIINVGLNIGF